MKRRGSSGRWLDEHRRDEFVQRAQREGRIARSAYKLIAIDERDKLLRPGLLVVDLGAAPGDGRNMRQKKSVIPVPSWLWIFCRCKRRLVSK